MSTENKRQPSKNLAEILAARDPQKYKAIIERAAANGYHDFKHDVIPGHPEYGDTEPKMQLIDDLNQFPELADIRERVIDGEFDDEADEEDQQRMRIELLNDDVPDVIFEQLGLKVPDQAERICHKRNRRLN